MHKGNRAKGEGQTRGQLKVQVVVVSCWEKPTHSLLAAGLDQAGGGRKPLVPPLDEVRESLGCRLLGGLNFRRPFFHNLLSTLPPFRRGDESSPP